MADNELNLNDAPVEMERVDTATTVDPENPAAVPSGAGLLTAEEKQVAVDAAKDFKPIGKKRLILRRFLRNKGAVLGVILLTLVVLFAVAVSLFSPYEVDQLDQVNTLAPPSPEHWLGTSLSGADIMTLLGTGTGLSLMIGTAVGIFTPLVAVTYGCTMAYFGGWVDKILLFILETMIMAPTLLIVSIVMAGKSGGAPLLVLLLVIFGWMGTARLVRGMSLAFVDREYVKAARYMGVPAWKVIQRHLVPNIASLTILQVTMGIWGAILSEVGFSYIGVGIKPPNSSLGLMIQQATESLDSAPWLFWAPIVTLTLITGPLALINDGLRDAFDPNSNSTGAA